MISACLVICNEKKLLSRCLDSIYNIADEIILVHDGKCTDKSLEIAKKYKAKIFVRNYVGEAEYHRPFSFEKAQGDWILQIDADEFLPPQTKDKIVKLISKPDIDGYNFWWPYFDGKKYISTGPFAKTYKPCLYRRNKAYMIGIAHEYIRSFGKMKNIQEIQLEHQPLYDNYSQKVFESKWIRWAKLHAKQIIEIEQASCFNLQKKEENGVYRYYLSLRKYPIRNAIIESIKLLALYLGRGLIISGRRSWSIADKSLKYLWMVRLEIERNKHGS